MIKKNNIIPKDNNIIRIPLEEAMPDNYLPYAVEVAKDRALPDVRDGLKPVHRRILYGSYLLKAFPDRAYYKSARIVGDILGKFHPHGDTSVYDAMVILSQNFSTREPLVDGHGNWGSIDGDGAAAMRYTEARLSNIAMEMLKDIDKDTVDMIPNYSDSELEPKVLPARYPNLLVNGTFGIAVGLATNIPPHNLEEVTEAVLALIDNKEIKTKELMEYIKGPDLPTGGILIGKNSLLSAYETGEGKVTLRAKSNIEKLENGRVAIIITEFPYKKNKSKILQTISEMTGDKKHQKSLDLISDIRDESDRNGIRAVIELKKTADEESADKILKYLFKKTDLQSNINFNMVALAEGKPQTMNLKTILNYYIEHQKDVVTRRTKKELDICENRFHIVEGFIKAIKNLEDVIKTIRTAKSKKDANSSLVLKFDFTEIQANAILELMLYRLTGLEVKTFEKEYFELEKSINKLKKILSNENELLKVIKFELKEITNKYRDDRRTKIIEDDSEAKIDIEELIVVEDVMITLSKEGFIKSIPLKTYNRSNPKVEDIEFREGDELKSLIKSNTTDTVAIFTDKGNMYQTKCANLPQFKWKDKGEKLNSIIKTLDLESEKIVNIFSINIFDGTRKFQFVTNKANIKSSSLEKFKSNSSKIQALKLKDNENLIDVIMLNCNYKKDFVEVITKNNFKFTLEVPNLEDSQRSSNGKLLFNLYKDDEIVSVNYVEKMVYSEFIVGLTKKRTLKSFESLKHSDRLKVKTDSNSTLLIFTARGSVYKIQTFMLGDILEKEISLDLLVEENLESDKIIDIISIKNFNLENMVYFFTKKGMIKKTSLKEYEINNSVQLGYKLKFEDDEVVNVNMYNDKEGEILLFTKFGFGIKFLSDNINVTGKIASGVLGITLKEDDEVIFGVMFLKENNNYVLYNNKVKNLVIVSKSKEKKVIDIDSIKIQNRAGKGNLIVAICSEDKINEVKIN